MEAGAPAPNPYAPPAADVDAPTNAPQMELDPASRWRRFFGAMIDGFFVSLTTVLGRQTIRLGFELGTVSTRFGDTSTTGLVSTASWVALALLQSYFIAVRGQSLGKMVVGTRIVGLDGKPAPFVNAVLIRTWGVNLLPYVPFVGSFVAVIDVLFIFGSQRRCLHDWVAGTKVVRIERPSDV